MLTGRFLLILTLLSPTEALLAEESSSSEVNQAVRTELHRLANTLDWVLGGTRADDIRNDSTLRLMGSSTLHQHHKPEFGSGVRLNTQIGTLERWRDRVTKWFEAEEKAGEEEIESWFGATPSKANSHHRHESEETGPKVWSFGLDKRIHYAKERLGGMVAGRVRADVLLGNTVLSPAVELGWDSKTLWRSTILMDYYIHLHDKTILVLGGSSTYHFLHHNFTYFTHANLGFIPDPKQVFTLGVKAAWNPPTPLRSQEIVEPSFMYRTEAFTRGLFLGLASSILFPSREQFRPFFSATISVEKMF